MVPTIIPSSKLNPFAQCALETLPTSPFNSPLPSLVFITDNNQIANPEDIIASLPEQQMVIVRDYDHPQRKEYARSILKHCRKLNHLCLIAGNPELCDKLNADGCHFPEWQQHLIPKIRLQYPQWILTTATHSAQAINKANQLKPDAILLSPLFKTSSHPSSPTLGIEAFRTLASESIFPVYALGGINQSTLPLCSNLPIHGIASISGFNHLKCGN